VFGLLNLFIFSICNSPVYLIKLNRVVEGILPRMVEAGRVKDGSHSLLLRSPERLARPVLVANDGIQVVRKPPGGPGVEPGDGAVPQVDDAPRRKKYLSQTADDRHHDVVPDETSGKPDRGLGTESREQGTDGSHFRRIGRGNARPVARKSLSVVECPGELVGMLAARVSDENVHPAIPSAA
jgi:hypothetical protein